MCIKKNDAKKGFPNLCASQHTKSLDQNWFTNLQMNEKIKYEKMEQLDYGHRFFNKIMAANATILKNRPYMNKIKIQSM